MCCGFPDVVKICRSLLVSKIYLQWRFPQTQKVVYVAVCAVSCLSSFRCEKAKRKQYLFAWSGKKAKQAPRENTSNK